MYHRIETTLIGGEYCPLPRYHGHHCTILENMLCFPAVATLALSVSSCGGGVHGSPRHSWESVYMVASHNDNEAGLVCLDDDSPSPCH